MAPQSQLGWGLISQFYSTQPDTSLRCEFPGPGQVGRWNVSVVATAHSCSSFLPTRRGMARLSRPGASMCKLSAQRNYAVTQLPATVPSLYEHLTTIGELSCFFIIPYGKPGVAVCFYKI